MKYDRSEVMFIVGELHKMLGRTFDVRGPFHVAYEETLQDVAERMNFKDGDEEYKTAEYVHKIIANGDAGDLGYICRVVEEMKSDIEMKRRHIHKGPAEVVFLGEGSIQIESTEKTDSIRDGFIESLKKYHKRTEDK